MLFADTITGSQVVILGVLVAAVVLILRRTVARPKQYRGRTLRNDMSHELPNPAAEFGAQIDRFEVRLLDYSRELESRIDTRMALLQEMLTTTDREIARLQKLLDEAAGGAPLSASTSTRSSTTDLPAAVQTLASYGFTAEQIAHATGQPIGEITLLLKLRGGANQSDAA
jgi:signal transduction histidine kinase